MYQSIHLENGCMGAERVSSELSEVRIPLTVEALEPALPLLLLHSAHGAKGLWNQGDKSVNHPPHTHTLPDHNLVTKIQFMPRGPQLAS